MAIFNSANPMFASGASNDVYSTEETRIGTGVDGRPLYRRVFDTSTPTTSSRWVTLENTVTKNVLQVYTLRGIYKNNSSPGDFVATEYHAGDNVNLQYSLSGGVMIYCAASGFLNKPILIVLEYTKTTDQATGGLPE